DQEIIYVTYIENGLRVNVMLTMVTLQHANSQGILDAIMSGLHQAGLSEDDLKANELKDLSLLFQRDGLTLHMVSDGLQKTTLALVAMKTVPGQHLKQFLDEVGPFPGNMYSGIELDRKQVDDDNLHKLKEKLINGFCDYVTT
ncbi:hypothetical protein KUCAC02_001787, partial [Chaenocephalus aceratus]